jgi:hypothetical protein
MAVSIIGRIVARFRNPGIGWKVHTFAVPVRHKQRFDLRLENGDEIHGLIAGIETYGHTMFGRQFWHSGDTVGTHLPSTRPFSRPLRVTHHRIHVQGNQPLDESTEARAHRENMFRDMLDPRRRIVAPEGPTRKPERVS